MPSGFSAPGPNGGPQTVTQQQATGPTGLGPQGTYGFSAAPRGQMAQPRKRLRASQPMIATEGETSNKLRYGNIMHDPHIIRGNTYAHPVLDMATQQDPIEIQRQQELRRRALAKRRALEQQRPKTPEAVQGRHHLQVQTENYLEELSNKVVEADVGCQTDDFLDRPPTPFFIPVKTGVDKETQIYQGDLFDFDIESKPLIAVLVGKTMEQALMEVMEEEELISLRQRQEEYAELRMAEAIEAQRLEEQERRLRVERDNRLEQMKEAERIRGDTLKKVQSHAFAKSYIGDLIPNLFGTLESSGFFPDEAIREVESEFLPMLMGAVDDIIDEQHVAMALLDGLIELAVDRAYGEFSDDSEDQDEPAPGEAEAVVATGTATATITTTTAAAADSVEDGGETAADKPREAPAGHAAAPVPVPQGRAAPGGSPVMIEEEEPEDGEEEEEEEEEEAAKAPQQPGGQERLFGDVPQADATTTGDAEAPAASAEQGDDDVDDDDVDDDDVDDGETAAAVVEEAGAASDGDDAEE